MKFTLLVVGKTTFSFISEGISMYEKRLSFYMNFSIKEIPELKAAKSLSESQIKQKEGELILKYVKNNDELILLDERGDRIDSITWSQRLEKFMLNGKDVIFVIGGAYGFSSDVYNRANGMLSLSKMTFSHQLIRVIFLEQLYRGCTIIKGEPYHHK